MSNFRLFILTLLVTTGVLTTWIYLDRDKSTTPKLVPVANGVFLTSQLQPANVRRLRYQIRTIVDIRPDGEAKDQASSAEIAEASKNSRVSFHYIPVPHETIPADAVEALVDVLSNDSKPMLLYCRTGRRAARTFALAEASQADGPDANAICKMVAVAGYSAEDLRGEIDERISKRHPTPEVSQ